MPEVVELYVVMYCEACATSVKKAVKRIPGVESYKVDYKGQKVTIVGNVDPEDVLRRVRRTGRQVTLIVTTAEPTMEAKKGDTNEEKKEVEKEETNVKEKKEVQVEEITSEGTKVVDTKKEVKTEGVVKVVETKEEEKKEEPKAEEKKDEVKAESKREKVLKREPERPKEPEWVQMFVTAPYYTLPSRFYN